MKKLLLNVLLLLMTAIGAVAQETLTVYESETNTNSYVPIYGYYVDNSGLKCEFVIPSEELDGMTNGTISAMKFYLSSQASAAWNASFQVFMKEVDYTTMSGFEGTTGATIVYSGVLNANSSTMDVNFTENYVYGGGNLLIGFYITSTGSYTSASFYGKTTDGNTAWQGYSSYSGRTFIPRTTFTYTPGAAPTCPKVNNLVADNPTSTTADITWEAGGTETAWMLKFGAAGFDVETSGTLVENLAATSYSLSGLVANTAYDVYVKAKCSESEESDWRKVSFRTACGVESVPYTEGFESFDANIVPNCWDNSASTTSSASGSNSYYVWGVYSYNSNKMLRMNNYWVENGTALINSPSINMPSDGVYQLSFDYSHTASCGTFTVRISDDGGSSFTELGSYAKVGTSTSYSDPGAFTEADPISLASYAGKTIILQFSVTANYGSGAIFVDNISIDLAPSCIKPTALAYSNVAARTAVLSWTAGGEETAWQICLNNDEVNPIDVNTNPYTLSGLDPETAYNVKVRANCGGGDYSEWTNNISFTTTVACPVPTAFTYSNISNTSVTVSWTAGASESLWNLKYKVSTDDEWTEVNALTSPTYTITELTPATSYNVQVQADCEEESVSTWLSGNFTTECDAVVAFPWTENFESYNSGNFSAICWSNEHIAGSSSNVFNVTTGTNGSNSTHQLQLPDMSDGNMVKLALPLMTLPNENYIFGIDVYRNNSYSSKTDEGVRVYASTNGEIDGATELAFIPRVYSATGTSVPAEGATGWYSYKFNIPFSGNCYIILRGESKYGTATYMDNFVVREISTAAEILTYSLPTEAAAATITSGDNAGTIDITVTNSTDFDADLNPTYTISEYAEISAPVISGDGDSRTIAYTVTAEAGNHKDWTVNVNKVPVSHDAFITEFTFAGQKAGTTAEIVSNTETNTYTVNAVADWNVDLTAIAPVITVSPAAEITPGSATTQDFSSMVAYTVTAEDGTTSHVYNVIIINDPDACVNPTDLEANGLTSHTATLNWLQAYTETAYIVKVSATELTDEELETATELVFNETVAALTANVEGLDANTQYFVYIQSDCENADGWAEYSFRTKCDAFNVPFVETFGNDSDSRPCWTIINANDDNKTWIYENGSVKYTYHSSNAANDWLISPKIAVVEGAYLTFEYKSSTSWPEKFSVYVMDAPENYATSTEILPTQTVSVGSFTPINNIDLAAYAGQDIYIGIKCESDADQLSLYIDNFKVKFPPFTITASAGENGSIAPNGDAELEYGESQAYTIAADACYHISSVLVDGDEAISNVDENGVYTFENVTADHTIVASFALNTYEITASVEGNGTVSETNAVVDCNDPKSFTFTPANDCYRLASVLVDGVEAINDVVDGVYTFTNVTADHNIAATFEQITYTFTVNAGENGTITANDVNGNVANCGEDKSFTIAANEGYSIASVMVDGSDVTDAVIAANGVYTFTNVAEAHTIAATFSINSYNLTIHYVYADDSEAAADYTATLDYGATYSVASPEITGYTANQTMVEGTMPAEDVTVTVTYNVNSYNLTIHYVYADDSEAAADYTATLDYGATYSVASPAITGYTANQTMVEGTMPAEDVTVTVTYNVNSYTLTIHYVYADNSEASADYTESVNYNATYSVVSPLIDGFTADRLVVEGTMGTEDVTETVTYTANPVPTHTLTIHYVYAETNEPAADDYTATLAEGADYSVASPAIDGFTADRLVIEGTMGTEDVTETVTYTANPVPTHTLTIHYVYAETNEPAADDYTATLAEGADYSVASPAIDGFTADRLVIEGTMGTEDVTETVTYTANSVQTYTITLTVGEHGTVTATDEDDNEIAIVDGVITVNDDDDLYLVITPEENYQIGELIVDGTPVELEEEDLAGFIFPILGVSSDMAVSVTFVPVSSVEMFEAGSMMVYPNPNNGMFRIDFSNIEGDATYEIINDNGAVVETRDINVMNGETMNFNHDLRPGTYFVRIINGDKVYVEQIVVE